MEIVSRVKTRTYKKIGQKVRVIRPEAKWANHEQVEVG